MTQANTDFGRVADDLRRAASSFALLTSQASLFGQAIQSFREFEKQLVLTNAIAGGTVSTLETMKTAAREFSLVTTTSAVEAGAALQQLAQAGFSAQESLSAMNGVLLLAQATMSDVRVTSDIVSSNIRAFGLATTDASRVANVFTAAITGSLATMDKLAFAMRQVAPVAELAGLSLEETTAALGVLFNIGLRGEQAGTALRNIIIRLVRPLGEAGDLLREAGVATKTATGEFRNLADIMEDIGNSNLSDSDLARIFETEALAGAKAFIKALQTVNEAGVNQYEALRSAITGTDRAVEVAAANLTTFDGEMLLFRNTILDVAKDLGETVAPSIITITNGIRGLVASFRELSPDTQETIAQFAVFGTAAVGMLASVNALALILRGPVVAGLASATAGFLSTTASASGFSLSLGGVFAGLLRMTQQLGATILTMAGYTSSVAPAAASTLTLSGAVTALIGKLAALKATLIANAGAIVLTATGLAAIGAVVGATVYALDRATFSVEELNSALRDGATEDYQIAHLNAQEVAEGIISGDAIAEIKHRVSRINKELALAGQGLDLAGYAGRKAVSLKTQIVESDDAIASLEKEFAGVADFFRLERVVNAQIANWAKENENFIFEGYIEDRVAGRIRSKFLKDYLDSLTDEERARLDVLRTKGYDLLDISEEQRKQLQEVLNKEKQGITDFLIDLQEGDAALSQFYQEAAIVIKESGVLTGSGTITAIANALAETEGAVTQKDVLRDLLERAGVDENTIVDLLTKEQQKRQDDFLAALIELNNELSSDTEDVRLTLLEQELERTNNLTEAIRIARELGNGNLEKELNKLSDDLTKQFGKVLVEFGVDQYEGIEKVLQSALDGAGISLSGDSIPGFAEVVDGSALINAINNQIDESTTADEAATIIQREQAKYAAIMQAYVDALISAGIITKEQAEQVKKAAKSSTELLTGKYLEGLGDVQVSIEEQKDRIKREADKATRKADADARKANQKARKTLRLAQQMESEFRSVAKAMADAQRSYTDAVRGLNVETREQLSFDLDIQSIARDAEAQITALNDKFDQLAIGYEGDSAALYNLRSQYDELIKIIELERDANIAAASSFEAQMQRRSSAIDLFIRDMQDVAFASQDTFTKVGAGIATAFAEYNKDLVTLVDITKEATLDFIDTAATAVGDFIFDQENLWESFKKSMLNISRQIVEGFTKAFIQQSISSLTGGGGSIFGNALQPSKYGKEGLPSVGTGGLFGKLFPGLAGGGTAPNAAANTKGLEGVMQQVAAQTQQIYQTNLTQQQSTFQSFVTGLQAALNSVVSSVGAMAGAGVAGGGVASGVMSGAVNLSSTMDIVANNFAKSGDSLIDGIVSTADALGVSARDLATVISYETAGTFDPLKRGPTTQWGQHRGLIQFGEPQAARFGVDFSSYASAIETQLGPNGGIVKYLKASGFEEGMSILDLYSTINAGAPGRYYASDANNGGAPGNVLDKVNNQFGGHYAKADALLANLEESTPAMEAAATEIATSMTDAATEMSKLPADLQGILPNTEDALTPTKASFNPLDPSSNGTKAAPNTNPLSALTGGDTGMTAITTQFQTMFTSFMTQTQTTLTQFSTQFQAALQQAIVAVQQAASGSGTSGLTSLLPKFSTGGDVFGAGTATSDSIFALLSNGEHVTRAKQASLYRPLLHAINKGASQDEIVAALLRSIDGPSLPAFRYGGDVGQEFSYGSLGTSRVSNETNKTYIDKSRGGDNVTLRVNYVLNGASQEKGKFKRSGAQHAKQLMRYIDRARKNS